jgi:hypothetical protein
MPEVISVLEITYTCYIILTFAPLVSLDFPITGEGNFVY